MSDNTTRSHAGRRHRHAWAAGITAVVATALGLAAVAGSATAEVAAAASRSVQPGAGAPGPKALVTAAEQAFGLRLLGETVAADPTGNVTTSAISLADALAMLENGAAGSTLRQIAATLGTTSLTATEQDIGWAQLTSTLTAQARRDGIALDSANGLWLQKGFPLRVAFLSAMTHWFGTGVSSVDFAHDLTAALGSINRWVSQYTDGKITQLFSPGQLNATTVLVLASAVFFHAAWLDPFDPKRTFASTFTAREKTGTASVPVEMMTGTVPSGTATAAYDVARLPYRGGHDEAIVIMPRHEGLPAFVAGLDPQRLDAIAALAANYAVVELPRFTTTSDLDLEKPLSAMGMSSAFTRSADLAALSPVPTMVQSVVQRDYLKVVEAGTEAAAATGISITPTAARVPTPPIVFNHPFVFVIRNVTSGALLFASAVENPAASSD